MTETHTQSKTRQARAAVGAAMGMLGVFALAVALAGGESWQAVTGVAGGTLIGTGFGIFGSGITRR